MFVEKQNFQAIDRSNLWEEDMVALFDRTREGITLLCCLIEREAHYGRGRGPYARKHAVQRPTHTKIGQRHYVGPIENATACIHAHITHKPYQAYHPYHPRHVRHMRNGHVT